MRRVTAMLAWFDEDPEWLYRAANTAGKLADWILAADGPFSTFPHDRVKSEADQYAAIRAGARDAGARVRVTPGREWQGQIAKRDHLMRAAKGSDWVFPIDADEEIDECDRDAVRAELAATVKETVEVPRFTPDVPNRRWAPDSTDKERPGGTEVYPRLFRYLADMRVETEHYRYTGTRPNGERVALWGAPNVDARRASQTVLVSRLRFVHYQLERSDEYRAKQLAYRAAVDERGRHPDAVQVLG